MKLRYHFLVNTASMTLELEAETAKELFRMLAEVQAIFEADKTCGRCGSSNLQCRVRSVDEGDYYELLCFDCLSTLPLGQTRKGGLFAKRKDKDGNILEKRGWRVAYGRVEREPEYAEEVAGPRR